MSLYDITEASRIEGPHGRIQWKGTEVCMDLDCSCGIHSHIDAEFAYSFRCECGLLWAVSPYVALIPITEDDAACSFDPVIDTTGRA